MDRKNIERPKKFNQREYNDKYQKSIILVLLPV